MSAITMPLKEAIKFLDAEAKVVDGVMVVTGDIGLSHYPIFDEAYRDRLNGKIVRHYWNVEIGVETPELFKFNLETDMGEFMPYFNQLYESELLAIDPLRTVDIKTLTIQSRKQDTTAESDSITESETESKSRAVNSNTPQTQLARNKDYATSGADSSGKGSQSGTNTEASSANMAEDAEGESSTVGYQGLQAQMLMLFRETFLNIDQSVIESVTDNFMHVTASGSRFTDSYTRERYGL